MHSKWLGKAEWQRRDTALQRGSGVRSGASHVVCANELGAIHILTNVPPQPRSAATTEGAFGADAALAKSPTGGSAFTQRLPLVPVKVASNALMCELDVAVTQNGVQVLPQAVAARATEPTAELELPSETRTGSHASYATPGNECAQTTLGAEGPGVAEVRARHTFVAAVHEIDARSPMEALRAQLTARTTTHRAARMRMIAAEPSAIEESTQTHARRGFEN